MATSVTSAYRDTAPTTGPAHTTVAIIGAGFAGIGTAIRLEQAGIGDYVILEQAADVGGTWRDNTYPGCACDIPSHLYSLSFAPKADWTHKYSRQPEIWDYLREVADEHDLHRRMWTGARVSRAVFDEPTARWELEMADGRRLTARVVVSGIGGLRDPKWPSIDGMSTFGGTQVHTARWDPDLDLTGKRVGVVGTGASAIQVIPAAAEVAEHVSVFQRTPAWVTPRHDRAYTALEKRAFEEVPGLRLAHRLGIYITKELRYVAFDHAWVMRPIEKLIRRHMRRHVDDPELADKLEPDYRMGCKRVLVSDDYYPALAEDHVEVVTEDIDRVTPDGIRTADGTEHELDVIVWATGFDILNMLGELDIVGTHGQTLAEYWDGRPAAYQGITVPGFPNLFMLQGPNTGLGHNSVVLMLEAQMSYVLEAVERLQRHEHVAYVDVTEQALDRWKDEVTRRTRRSVWATGCDSWYLGPDGYNFTLWPGSTLEYRLRTRRFDARSYRIVRWSELPTRAPAREPGAVPV